jgi:hypothetical protein
LSTFRPTRVFELNDDCFSVSEATDINNDDFIVASDVLATITNDPTDSSLLISIFSVDPIVLSETVMTSISFEMLRRATLYG